MILQLQAKITKNKNKNKQNKNKQNKNKQNSNTVSKKKKQRPKKQKTQHEQNKYEIHARIMSKTNPPTHTPTHTHTHTTAQCTIYIPNPSSIDTSPNSFSNTQIFHFFCSFKMKLTNVVLPAPRNPGGWGNSC